MKKFVLLGVVFCLFIAGCEAPDMSAFLGKDSSVGVRDGYGPTITINGKHVFSIELADTYDERAKGLMFRENLPENNGMFFIFEDEAALNFWMKNTLISLDIIYFDSDYRIVRIQKNAQPCKEDPCDLYPSVRPAKYVLEVNGGVTDELGIDVGQSGKVNL